MPFCLYAPKFLFSNHSKFLTTTLPLTCAYTIARMCCLPTCACPPLLHVHPYVPPYPCTPTRTDFPYPCMPTYARPLVHAPLPVRAFLNSSPPLPIGAHSCALPYPYTPTRMRLPTSARYREVCLPIRKSTRLLAVANACEK
jgi:hypothetical protein